MTAGSEFARQLSRDIMMIDNAIGVALCIAAIEDLSTCT